jgi:CHAT domain-containing protein
MGRFFLILMLCSGFFHGTNSQNISPDSTILQFYREQVAALGKSRGLDPTNFDLEEFSKFNSFEDISSALNGFYPKKDIAFISYFYSEPFLIRVLVQHEQYEKRFFKDSLKIERSRFAELSQDIFRGLKIFELLANRAPLQRNVKLGAVQEKKASSKTLDKAIDEASWIIFPPDLKIEGLKHIVFVPTMSLGAMPYYLLKPKKDGSSLIDICSYSVAPGIFDILAFNAQADDRRRVRAISGKESIPYLFVANPTYPKKGPFIFPDLPGAEKEVKAITQNLTNYQLLGGKEATRDKVLSMLPRAEIAYFATHGMAANNKFTMDSSFLVLSGETNGYLTARDIINLRDSTVSYFNARSTRFPKLTVLSACQTGLGLSLEAGIAGLARSFLIAGSEQVIMSLWNVDDDATAYLMTQFFEKMKKPEPYPPAEALRQAALETRKKYPDPAKWASFSVFGVVRSVF